MLAGSRSLFSPTRIAPWCGSSITPRGRVTAQPDEPEREAESKRSFAQSGMPSSPRSQRASVFGATPTALASSACVKPRRFRRAFNSVPEITTFIKVYTVSI